MKETSDLVAEQHRPHFHFTPPEMWMNDPNGMVYFDGEYHLCYQYYPYDNVWGPMHWGHAISKDLVTWQHLPIALYPDPKGYIFSGSTVIDWNNTSGFAETGDDIPPMVAIFTHHEPGGEKLANKKFQYQSIAYSNDKGRTWTKYEGNPVIPNPGIKDFRDPKVIWDKSSQQWIMVFAAWDLIKIYGSSNLKDWTHLSDFGQEWGTHGGVWECPDLFPMKVEETGEEKWVLLQSLNPGGPNGGSATQYFVGDFDGKEFTLDAQFANDVKAESAVWLDYGRDNYAGVTWSDIPTSDNRRIFIGWMSNWDYALKVPTDRWRSAMTIPRELTLHKTNDGFRVFSKPVNELTTLRKNSIELESGSKNGLIFSHNTTGGGRVIGELDLTFSTSGKDATKLIVELSNSKGENYKIGFDASTNQYFSDRTNAGKKEFSEKFASDLHVAPRFADKELIKFHLFIDVASAELFADDGQTVLTDIFFPNEDFSQLKVITEEGVAIIEKGTFYAY